ncbi:Universal stress protein [Nocardioides dokdonensis FR1436]|uniref:Universal stress protein n=1 Tax=Nocardioides dokdonensis FR1436 TaxID=1300347 RepID=A0A1A9GJZ8_9ACTN|nr:universal stress protein [Nocardioides dokdonensis]ANH38584.1 Universal stress protein [Nocardioides dokdonensis FR1436]
MNPTGPVLVGIDSSENAKSALRWAAGYARHVGVDVEAVIAWDVPATYGYAMVTTPDPPEYEEFAAAALRSTVLEVLGEDAAVVQRTVRGHPAQVLVEATWVASLLVVGSRGHGSWGAALLGSVSQHCVQQAHCPVVVIPHGVTA